MRFLELETRTYMGKDFREYLKSSQDDSEDIEPGDEWKRELQEDREVELPKAHTSRVRINPEMILSYIETFSLEEMHQNPQNPRFDSLDICMMDGLQLTVLGTMAEFEEKLDKHFGRI